MWVSELFAVLTLKLRLDPQYVLDLMDFNHLDIYIKYAYYADQTLMEQARLVNYVNLQMNSRKKLKLTDLYQFSWEKTTNHVTQADRDRLTKLAQSFENKQIIE